MLIIEGLRKHYRGASSPALDGVSLHVGPGELLALLGPNGAGKSTLIGVLAGWIEADAGSVAVAGVRLDRRRPDVRAQIGIVPQEVRLDFVFTVEELLRLEMGFYGLRRDDDLIRLLLERLSLADKRHVRSRSLSGGMQRRLMIARALVHRPRLLLLDEPTTGIDIELRRSTHELFREVNRAGTTIVLTTHHLEDAESLCERIVLLQDGRIVADAPREDFARLAGDFVTVDIHTLHPDRVWSTFEDEGAVSLDRSQERLRFAFPAQRRASLLERLAAVSPHIRSFEVLKPGLEEAFVKLTQDVRP